MDRRGEGTNTSNKAEKNSRLSRRPSVASVDQHAQPAPARTHHAGPAGAADHGRLFFSTCLLMSSWGQWGWTNNLCSWLKAKGSRLLCSRCAVQPSSQDLKIVNKESSESCQPYRASSNRRHSVFKRLVWREKVLNVGESARGSASPLQELELADKVFCHVRNSVWCGADNRSSRSSVHCTDNDGRQNKIQSNDWTGLETFTYTLVFLSSSSLRRQSANRETADSTGEAYLSMAPCASADPKCRSFCHFHRFFSLGGGGTSKVSVTWQETRAITDTRVRPKWAF